MVFLQDRISHPHHRRRHCRRDRRRRCLRRRHRCLCNLGPYCHHRRYRRRYCYCRCRRRQYPHTRRGENSHP